MLLPIYKDDCVPGDTIKIEDMDKFKNYIEILWIKTNSEIWNKVDEYIAYKYGFSMSHNLY